MRTHTAVRGPDRIQPPPPRVLAHQKGHQRVPTSWSYRTKKTGKCEKNIYVQQAKHNSLFHVGTALALLIRRATHTLDPPGLHLQLLFPN